MPVVLSLVKKSNRETSQLLESLANESRRGEITDVCVTFRRRDGSQDTAFSGVYLRNPAQALLAISTLKADLIAANSAFAGL